MDTDIIPAHIHGRHMGTFLDPVSTVNQDNLEIGGYVRVSTKKDAQC